MWKDWTNFKGVQGEATLLYPYSDKREAIVHSFIQGQSPIFVADDANSFDSDPSLERSHLQADSVTILKKPVYEETLLEPLEKVVLMPESDVKMHLCTSIVVEDSEVVKQFSQEGRSCDLEISEDFCGNARAEADMATDCSCWRKSVNACVCYGVRSV